MKIIQNNSLNKFTNLISGFTTKKIGNLAFHVNDNKNHVQKNHEALAKELAYNRDSLIHMKQIHSSNVKIVNNDDNFTNPQECDALVTNKKNIPLMVMVADCSPILFYDQTKKIIAVAHAGRKGAFKNIVQETINTMKYSFDSNIDNIFVSVGASIGVCCYQVGDEIYSEAEELGLGYSLVKKETAYHLNITRILKTQLLTAGIQENNIEISKECTCCLNNKYYSYRANPQTGRFAGIIMLK